MKTSSDYSGYIEAKVDIGYLAINDGMPLRDIKANVAHYLTEQLAGRVPRKAFQKRAKESKRSPFLMAEIESAMGDNQMNHGIRLGVHIPNAEGASCAECLEMYASDIADAVVDLLPTPSAVAQNGMDQILFTSCDIALGRDGGANWKGFESRHVPKAVARILKLG